MKKTKLLVSGAIIVASTLTSCSPFTLVNSQVYNDANLAEYKTFRIVNTDESNFPPGMTSVTYYNIAAAIREQMEERGYTEDPSSPLLINFGITVHREIQTEPLLSPNYFVQPPPPLPRPGLGRFFLYPRTYWTPSYYANAQVITGIYKEGVLTVDMVNIDTKTPLYSASVATVIDNGSQYRNLTAIAEAVQTLFSKYPVPILPQYKGR